MDAAWPDTAVEEGNLTVQIAQLRKLLGPAADGSDWIATVPRVGYRFTGAIERLGGARRKPLPLPAKPSVAVLPFVNIGNDPEQDFSRRADRRPDHRLSRTAGLFVIARNSTFAYKGKAVDVRGSPGISACAISSRAARGARRRACGSMSSSSTRSAAISMWAERFDRNVEDIFTVQDEVIA